MNLDYIEIAKFTGKDKPNFHSMEKEAVYPNAERYSFQGCKKIEVWNYPEINQIKIKGSIPYFINGHNYFASLNDWKEGLDYLQGSLGLNLYSGLIECFEFGTIQEIPFSPASFLQNHIKVSGMEGKEFRKGNVLTGKEFHSPSLKLKIYDCGRNIKNKLDKGIQEEINRLFGWEKAKHYIKLESHYRRPEAHFKGNVYLAQLLTEEFQRQLQINLLNQYQRIMKTGKAIIPERKADINAGTLPLIILKELEGIHNFRTEELLKALLKEIPEEILSPADKKARQRILKENLNKIRTAGESEFDISKLIKSKINEAEKESTPFLYEEKGEEILSH
jgi:hypothetical protein